MLNLHMILKSFIKQNILICCLFFFVNLNLVAAADNLIGRKFPDFKLPKLENNKIQLSNKDLLNSTNIIQLWSSDDKTSKQQEKILKMLNTIGMNMIGIQIKNKIKLTQEQIMNLPYNITLQDTKGKLTTQLAIQHLPATLLVDKTGIIRYQIPNNDDENIWIEQLETAYKRLIQEEQIKM